MITHPTCKQNAAPYIALGELPQTGNVCIYGTGSGGKGVFDALKRQRPGIRVTAFADSFKRGVFQERPILAPDELAARQAEFDLILVASVAAEVICGDLYQRGLSHVRAISMFHLTVLNFTDDDLRQRAQDIARITEGLATQADRELFSTLVHLRWEGSDQVTMLQDEKGQVYSGPRDSTMLSRRFPDHTRQCYFDFGDLKSIRVCVQAGVYAGHEAAHILKQAPNLSSFWGFEPQGYGAVEPALARLLKAHPVFKLVPQGLWSERTRLTFIDADGGSFLGAVSPTDKDGMMIPVTDLDSFLDEHNSPPLDFFFCDIENAELPCLQGMRKRLLSDRPQLAVSIYHSKQQFLDVPLFLMNLLDGYDFHIGHYARTLNETTFYAIPEKTSCVF